ncbi:AGAP005481-PA-like protein [Anopheles sinensis]|uniref:AGAP005481-PA-like protein n=1 Tax=Anopheles sinensis TaxID=74873 RepID=A0A084W2W9_ANOSI|nr:AGAP005481-PA-like protein [Anopheles sinensis]
MEVQCRLCLGQASAKLVLFLSNEELRLMVDSVFNFKIISDPRLTESVCLQCSSTVQEFYQYSKKVRTNQELLEEEHLVQSANLYEKLDFENVLIDDTSCENTNNESNCAADHPVKEPHETNAEITILYGDLDETFAAHEVRRSNDTVTINRNPSNGNSPKIQEFEIYDDDTSEVKHFEQAQEPASSVKLEDRFHRCELCDRLFSNSLHFKTHQSEHRKKECPICGKNVNAKYLPMHIADMHQTKPAASKKRHEKVQLPASQYERDRMIDLFIGIRCELCQFGIYKTFADLQMHYRTKHGVQGYVRCCGDKLVTQSAAAEHVLVHQGAFACKYCDKTFVSKRGLIKHMATKHDEKAESRVFRCRLCNITFTSEEKFIHHRKKHERKECPICGKTVRKSYLKKHIQDVHADPSKNGEDSSSTERRTKQSTIYDQMILDNLGLRCELCPPEAAQDFDQFNSLRTHYSTEHNMRGYVRCCGKQFFIRCLAVQHIAAHKGIHRCQLCDKTFSTRTSLKNHMGIIHASDNPEDRSYDCDECDSSFSTKPQLRVHQKRHKLTQTECALCGKSVRSDYIQKHIATQHGEKCRQLICHVCGKAFSTECVLKAHMKQHLEPHAVQRVKPERAECAVCKKMIRGKYSMKKHMKDMHSAASNQQCSVCGKFIRSSTAMKQHMRIHQGSGMEKLQCPFCFKWVKGKTYLRKHIQCLHEEKGQLFRCDVCQHESPNSQALAAHKQRVHEFVESGDKLKCEYCGKNFKRSIYLREHIALHTGEQLYTCEFCGKKFKSNANYYSHRKKNHSEELQGKNETETNGQ